jgi:hypothetical protein
MVINWYSTEGNLETISSTNGTLGLLSPASDELRDQLPEMKSQELQSQDNSITEATKSPQKKYFCKFSGCGNRSFSDSTGLNRHMLAHDPNAKHWICGECGRKTLRKDHMSDHLRKLHALPKKVPPLSCPTCSYSQDGRGPGRKGILFSKQASLAKHIADEHTEAQASQDGTSTSGFDFSALDPMKSKSPIVF